METTQKKISIIVPVYNTELYLKECIDSIINQTYKNIEIICIDDGSTDKSASILDEYSNKDNRIIVIHKENGGVSSARNKGLDIATGDYIGFVDSDDYILPNMYEEMINLLESNNADISICSFTNIKNSYKGPDLIMTNIEGIYQLNEGAYFKGHLANKLYKKELWNNIRLDESISICEDKLVNHYVFYKANKIVFQNIPLYYYRSNENSALNRNKFNPKYLSILLACEKMCNFITDFNIDINGISKTIIWKGYYMTLKQLYDLTNKNEYIKEKKKCLKGYRNSFKLNIINKYNRIEKFYIIGLLGGYFSYKITCKSIYFLQRFIKF